MAQGVTEEELSAGQKQGHGTLGTPAANVRWGGSRPLGFHWMYRHSNTSPSIRELEAFNTVSLADVRRSAGGLASLADDDRLCWSRNRRSAAGITERQDQVPRAWRRSPKERGSSEETELHRFEIKPPRTIESPGSVTSSSHATADRLLNQPIIRLRSQPAEVERQRP